MSNSSPRHLTLLLGLLALAGCITETTGAPPTAQSDSPWLEPSPLLAQQIESESQRLPWTRDVEQMEQIRWFARVGEPAYETLLELAVDDRDNVAAAALAALGATGDRRLVPYLQELDWTPERLEGDLGLERARTLVRLGDWSAIPVLVRGLNDDRLITRRLCYEALYEATREDQGYDPHADAYEREKSVDRWKDWWLRRTGEGLVTAGS